MSISTYSKTHEPASQLPCPKCGSYFMQSHVGEGKPKHPGTLWTPALDAKVQHRCMKCLHYWTTDFWLEILIKTGEK